MLADHLVVCWSPITAQEGINVSTSVTYILHVQNIHACVSIFLRFASSGLFYLLARTLELHGTISFLTSIKFKVSAQSQVLKDV